MEVQLTRGMVALVDDEDFERVSQHKWAASPNGNRWYGQTNVKRPDGSHTTMRLHRFVLRLPPGRLPEVDHENHDGLDCRKENLRQLTRSQNAQNQRGAHRDSLTGVRGVSFDKRWGRYKVVVITGRRSIYLGSYPTIAAAEQAAIAGRRKYMSHSPECAVKAERIL